jgi:hypothetical protein
MMKNLMVLGSVAQDMEPEEDPSEKDVMPFTGEDAIMTVYNGHPLKGGAACPTFFLEPQLAVVGNPGTQGCKGTSFSNIYIYVYYNLSKRNKKWQERWLGAMGAAAGQSISPWNQCQRGAPLTSIPERG